MTFSSDATNLVPDDTNGFWDIFVRDRDTGQTTLVSVNSQGEQANWFCLNPSISHDGRFVAFESDAWNLVLDDFITAADIFVHDRQTGETTKVSVNSDGEQANLIAQFASISGDGRFVAFQSAATNLVPGDTNGANDVFVHDRQTGETTRISVSSVGGQGNGNSQFPSISFDGRLVAFASNATNLVPGDTNGAWDIFVHDRQTGQTKRVSVSSEGVQANSHSLRSAISADGCCVVFNSESTNLVPGDTNGVSDVFVHKLAIGQTTRVSVSSEGEQAVGGNSHISAISADGRFIAFPSVAWNLVPDDTNDMEDVFVHDRQTGETTRVSVSSSGVQGNGFSSMPSISADGRIVSFHSNADNLAPVARNGFIHVFAHDRGAACAFADLNCDGAVDVLDLLILLGSWGSCPRGGPGSCPADLNNGGTVDVQDLLILLANWG